LGGISLLSARVKPKGFEWDRRWMLVDENNQFLTQRVHSAMALFRLSLQFDGIVVNHQGDTLAIPFAPPSGNFFDAVIWDDTVQVSEVNPAYSEWFSKRLNIPCKLVSFPENNPRPVDAKYKLGDDHVGLADAYPYLIIGQSSLNDLNSRLAEPLPMNRFRPNLVFTGGEAFEEDSWKKFRVAGNWFAAVKPCARCVLTTVNQDTGEKGMEPLVTLAKYRRAESKVLFGQNVIAIDYKHVSVGDEIVFE
jgi:uncharacterized protein